MAANGGANGGGMAANGGANGGGMAANGGAANGGNGGGAANGGNGGGGPVEIPELDGLGAPLALALVAGIGGLAIERRRRKAMK